MNRVVSLVASFLVIALQPLTAVSASTPVASGVWTASATWTEAQETKYSQWVRTELTEDFFVDGPWAGIKTDCADAVYAARIIFSYLNSLPFSLGPKYPKFDHRTTAFDHIRDPKQRVLAFIEAVNNRTWTGSLSSHTIPIEISRATIVPGTLWMKPGHVEIVREVSEKGVVEVRGSWLPAALRNMISITTLGHAPGSTSHGFRRWIWPQDMEKKAEDLQGFSRTQFVHPLEKKSHLDEVLEIRRFENQVQRRLALVSETIAEKIERRARDFCKLVEVRFDVVRLGYDHATSVDRCMNDAEYFAYSTPSRDAGLRRLVIELGLLLGNDLGKLQEVLVACTRPGVASAGLVEPTEFFKNILTLDFSSDPHDLPAVRFGLPSKPHSCRAQTPRGT